MSFVGLRSLLQPKTRSEVADGIIGSLRDLGFRVDAWQPGSVALTMVQALSYALADAQSVAVTIASNALDQNASGAWLDVVSTFYANEREPARPWKGTIQVQSDSGSPTHNITAGQTLFTRLPDGFGTVYRFTEDATITPGNTNVKAEAVEPGADTNIDIDAAPSLVTPLTGVGLVVIGIDQLGTDREPDARLRQRNASKWAELSYGARPDAYRLWTLEAEPAIAANRVGIANDGSGGMTITVSGPLGDLTSGQLADITAYLEARAPFGDSITVQNATELTVNIEIAPTILSGTSTAQDVRDVITEYLASVPLGGSVVAPSTSGQVIRDEIIERVMALPGVQRANLTVPSGDVAVASDEVPVAQFDDVTVTFVG